MSPTVAAENAAPTSARIWGRRALTALAMICTTTVCLLLIGALLPQVPPVVPIATFVESVFSVQIALAAVTGPALALAARRLAAGRVAVAVAARRTSFITVVHRRFPGAGSPKVIAPSLLFFMCGRACTAGEYDQLVPFTGHLELGEKSNPAGVPNVLIAIPYGEHAYDLYWGGLGAQITPDAAEKFLKQYLPAVEAH